MQRRAERFGRDIASSSDQNASMSFCSGTFVPPYAMIAFSNAMVFFGALREYSSGRPSRCTSNWPNV